MNTRQKFILVVAFATFVNALRSADVDASKSTKPYDRFILEQLAGDALGVDEATGFIVGGASDQVKSPDPVLTANQRADELHDIVSTTSSAFLGLTVGCARCHNHKFDPIPQTDYFAIKAVFEGVQHGERRRRTTESVAREKELVRCRDRLTEVERELEQFEPLANPMAPDTNSLRSPVNARKNIERFTPVPNLETPHEISPAAEVGTRDFLKLLNDRHLARHPGDSDLSARIAAYELAARMQISAAEVADLSKESKSTLELYGVNDANKIKAGFARNCVLARRLVERGVRFVQLFNGAYAMGEGVGNWDGHKSLKTQYDVHRAILDQPCAALIKDLKSRGLLEQTLVAFVTEFGRMPTFQKGASGRDHNPHGFTVWLTGAGVKRGFSYGATDEFGHKAVKDASTIYDLHATILHLLGLNHEQLSYYHNGTERRLTDVHGEVLTDILA